MPLSATAPPTTRILSTCSTASAPSIPGPVPRIISAKLGRFKLKWEAHTEFVTYTLFVEGEDGEKFAEDAFDLFPKDWLDRAPGVCISSALIRVDRAATEGEITDRIDGLVRLRKSGRQPHPRRRRRDRRRFPHR